MIIDKAGNVAASSKDDLTATLPKAPGRPPKTERDRLSEFELRLVIVQRMFDDGADVTAQASDIRTDAMELAEHIDQLVAKCNRLIRASEKRQ